MDKLEQILKEYQKLIDKYSWKDKFPIRKKWLKKKKKIQWLLLMWYALIMKKNILPTISKYSLVCEKQNILLMIPHKEQWYYIVVTKLSALLRGVTLIRNAAFYCVNFLHSFRTKNVLLIIKEYAEIKTFAVLEHLLKKICYYFLLYTCISIVYLLFM